VNDDAAHDGPDSMRQSEAQAYNAPAFKGKKVGKCAASMAPSYKK